MHDQGVRVMQVRQGLRIATPVGLRRARQQVFNVGFHEICLLNEGAVQGLKATLSLPESTETPVRKASRIVALFVLQNGGLYDLSFRR